MKKIFLSYASEDHKLADQIQLALTGGGYYVFFDRDSLPSGADYHARIRAAVDSSDIFVFLLTKHSVVPGGYTLTELKYARSKWRHPKGHVLPVLAGQVLWDSIPPYLREVTALKPEGNVPAEVLAAATKMLEAIDPPKDGRKRLGIAVLLAIAAVAGVQYWVGHKGDGESCVITTFPEAALQSEPNPFAARLTTILFPRTLDVLDIQHFDSSMRSIPMYQVEFEGHRGWISNSAVFRVSPMCQAPQPLPPKPPPQPLSNSESPQAESKINIPSSCIITTSRLATLRSDPNPFAARLDTIDNQKKLRVFSIETYGPFEVPMYEVEFGGRRGWITNFEVDSVATECPTPNSVARRK